MIEARLTFLGNETVASAAGYIIVVIAVETVASILGNVLHGMAKALLLG